MKRFLLTLMVLQGVYEIHGELTSSQKTVVAAGAAGLSFLWFWNREPNSSKIVRVHNLYQDCQSCIGKQQAYAAGDPEETLQQIRSCTLMQRSDEVIACYKDVKGRHAWFWNKSNDLSKALNKMKRLERNLREYQYVENQLEQQVVINQVGQLWLQLSSYIPMNGDYQVVDSITLHQLRSHPIVRNHESIVLLYSELQRFDAGKGIRCNGFDCAYERIVTLNKNLSKLQNLIYEIERYERLTKKYQHLLKLDINNVIKRQNIVMNARALGQGAYPLINFVSKLRDDIRSIRNLSLQFAYVKVGSSLLQNTYVSQDAKLLVAQMLDQVANIVTTDGAYRDEQRRQEEQRMHEERMRLEQERLRIERERLRAEQVRVEVERARVRDDQEKVKAARDHIKNEEKKLQADLDRAYANEGRSSASNSLQSDLDRAYEEESYSDHNSWW